MNTNPEFIYICDRQPDASGSLNGIRLGVKDLFDLAGIPTTAGNPDWLKTHAVPQHTAPIVTALLEAGAILIGKTLTDELAYSLEGINKHYGTPTNPQAPERLPGGSSSGSAVAVANGSIDLGLGTDTGGSIRVPASYNGIYGLRPSHGLISCQHLVPLSPRFDTVGWLARDLATIEKAADVLLPPQPSEELSHLIIARVAGMDNWRQVSQTLTDPLADLFDSVEAVELSSELLVNASQAFRVLQGREIWRSHGDWIQRCQPDFAVEISDRFKWCSNLKESDEQQAELTAQEFCQFWQDRVLPSNKHILLMPTTPGAAPLLDTPAAALQAYRRQLMGLTAPAGLTRAPQISLPYLRDLSATWGLSLLATTKCDRALLDCAARLDSLSVSEDCQFLE